MKKTFHCRKINGEPDFSIDEWNKAFQYCIDNNLSETETDKILSPPACEEQCFDCMADVGETRIKTKSNLKQ